MNPAPTAATRPSARRQALVTMAVAALIVAVELVAIGGKTLAPATVNTRLGPPQNRAEKLIWGMDGKAFFQIGVDPTFAHAADAYRSAPHGAYRSSRPVVGWLAWAASGGGHREVLGWSLLALSIGAIGLLVLALDAVARALGWNAPPLVMCLLAPGLMATLVYPGLSEPLALALAFFGMARWLDEDRAGAVALFALAAMTRETTLFIPAAIGLEHLWRTRRVRGAWPLALPAVLYVAWVGIIRVRVGSWPTGAGQFSAPFTGYVHAMPSWGPMEWATLAFTVAAAWAAMRSKQPIVQWITGLHLGLLVCLNQIVVSDWWAFGRLSLPICLLGILAVPTTLPARHPAAAASA